MPEKTPVERMREYRKCMTEEEKIQVRKKNQEQKNCRSKWDPIKRKKESVKSKESKAKLRLSQKIGTLAKLCSDSSALLESTPNKAFGSRQSYGKAMKRMKSSLPKSPEKRKL